MNLIFNCGIITSYATNEGTKDKSQKIYDNIKKKIEEKYEEIMELEVKNPEGPVEPDAWVEAKTKGAIHWWQAVRNGVIEIGWIASLFCIIFGLLIVFIFKKDKMRQKRGYLLAIGGPLFILLIVYWPVIISVFKN